MDNETPDEKPVDENVPTAEQPGSEQASADPSGTDEPATESAPSLTFNQGGGEVSSEALEAAAGPRFVRGKLDSQGVAMGTGRRKTSVARVRLRPGNGAISINGRAFDNYFCVERDRLVIEAPLRAADMHGKVDIWVRVNGGGTTGQAGAIVLGIARALEALNSNLHRTLSDGGFLTRDSRMVERKKYGKKKARRSFQFSKR